MLLFIPNLKDKGLKTAETVRFVFPIRGETASVVFKAQKPTSTSLKVFFLKANSADKMNKRVNIDDHFLVHTRVKETRCFIDLSPFLY